MMKIIKRKLFSILWTCLVTIVTATALLLIWSVRERMVGTARSMEFPKVNTTRSNVFHQVVEKRPNFVAERLKDRKLLIERLCRQKTPGKAYEITGNKEMKVSFCVVPKAGCTVWIRMFKYLAGQKSYASSPMEISKFEVHYKELLKYKFFDMKKSGDEHLVRHSLRVVTVRDPWTRLWSAYIDKLLLPDFWHTKGKQIIRQVRKHASQKSLRCGHDVTFPEFVQYVIETGHSVMFLGQDKHWLPASDICDPCAFKPEIITKQETLLDDFTYVMRERRMEPLLHKMKVSNYTEYEIFDEIKYNFAIHKTHRSCISVLELCKRMWTAFKLNGYIPEHETFDKIIRPLNQRTFLRAILNIHKKNNMTKADTKRLRRKALIQAFSNIPSKDILALKELYRDDFTFFNYDRSPDFLKA